MRHKRKFLRYLIGCTAALSLASCSSPDSQASRGVKEPGRHSVPFVYPLPLVAMEDPLVLDFDLPPQRKGGSDSLVVGLRIDGESRLASGEIARAVASADVATQISLEKIGDASTRPIPLVRWDPRPNQPSEIVEVVDGHVAGISRFDMDWVSMREAGLVEPDYTRRHLGFAWAQAAKPGRYRLSIQINRAPNELERIPSELLVAYAHQPK